MPGAQVGSSLSARFSATGWYGPSVSPTRRHLARTALWAVPTVAVATAAPAYAASAVPCPTIPTSSTWTKTINGPVANAKDVYYGTSVQFMTDANGATATTVTYDIPVTVTGGVTYQIAFSLQTAPGYSGSCVTQNSSLALSMVSPAISGGTQNLGNYRTQSGGSSATVVAPFVDCNATANTPGTYAYGANGKKGAVYTTPVSTVVVSGSGSSVAHIQLTFTLDPTTKNNNDDWVVTPYFVACTRN